MAKTVFSNVVATTGVLLAMSNLTPLQALSAHINAQTGPAASQILDKPMTAEALAHALNATAKESGFYFQVRGKDNEIDASTTPDKYTPITSEQYNKIVHLESVLGGQGLFGDLKLNIAQSPAPKLFIDYKKDYQSKPASATTGDIQTYVETLPAYKTAINGDIPGASDKLNALAKNKAAAQAAEEAKAQTLTAQNKQSEAALEIQEKSALTASGMKRIEGDFKYTVDSKTNQFVVDSNLGRPFTMVQYVLPADLAKNIEMAGADLVKTAQANSLALKTFGAPVNTKGEVGAAEAGALEMAQSITMNGGLGETYEFDASNVPTAQVRDIAAKILKANPDTLKDGNAWDGTVTQSPTPSTTSPARPQQRGGVSSKQ